MLTDEHGQGTLIYSTRKPANQCVPDPVGVAGKFSPASSLECRVCV
jgi:hypothetical protein